MNYKKVILGIFLICTCQTSLGQKIVPIQSNKTSFKNNNSQIKGRTSIIKLSSSSPKVALVNTSHLGLKKALRSTETKSFSGSFEVSRSSSLYDLKNGNKYDGMDYLFLLGYKVGSGALTSGLSYTQNLNETDEESSTINDSNLKYSFNSQSFHVGSIAAEFDWTSSVSAVIPLSKKSKEVDQLQTALIVSTNLTMVASEDLAIEGLGLNFGISAGQNFHSFETDKNGVVLNKNSSNQSVSLFYSLNKIKFLISYANKIRWAYKGEVRNSFEFSQDASLSFLETWTASIGHTNSGSTLKPNGMDSNISVIDDDNSIIYLGLSYGF